MTREAHRHAAERDFVGNDEMFEVNECCRDQPARKTA